MSGWFNQVKTDLGNVIDAITHYESEFEKAKLEVGMKGNLERLSREIPGIVAYRFAQLQEIEAILEYLNIQYRIKMRYHYRKYLEHYNKALSSRDAEKFAENEDEVVAHEDLVNEFALVRNKWIGIIKALEAKQFQISNIVKLRTSGLEDINLT